MSYYYALVCHETRQYVHIGQGDDERSKTIYSGDTETMSHLLDFLNATNGKPLTFLCMDRHDEVYEYEEFGDAEA